MSVDKNNPKEVADAIIILLRNEKLCTQMGIQARRIVESNYSWQIVGTKVQKILKEAVTK